MARSGWGNVGKALGTAAVWAGVCAVMYLLHSFGILGPSGAGWMVFGAFLLTFGIWKIESPI